MWNWFKKWFHQLGSPKWFYEKTNRWLVWAAIVAVCCLCVGSIWGLFFAPKDYQQGDSFRIIYFHVPSAILAQSCYMVMAISGIVGLVWKMKMAFMVAKSAAPLGFSMTILALFTGAIWGIPTWGTWWEWDARLTSMLILAFMYLGLMALHYSISNVQTADRLFALLAIVGVVLIPIIKYSVDWWNTLHQPATFTLTEKPAMPAEMWLPLLINVIGFYALFAWSVMMWTRNEILEREKKTKWVQSLPEIAEGAK